MKAHGLYTEQGQRIKNWHGKIVMDQNTGAPRLDPPLRLGRDERVYAWYEDQLVAVFTDGGMTTPIEKLLTLPLSLN
jgi:hypothetical protein